MATQMKFEKVAATFGIPAEMLADLKANQIAAIVQPDGVKFVKADAPSEMLTKVTWPTGMIKLIENDQIGDLTKTAFNKKLTTVISDSIKKKASEPKDVPVPMEADEDDDLTPMIEEMVEAPKKKSPSVSVAAPSSAAAQMDKTPVVSYEASAIYQACKGTSEGSKYFLVAKSTKDKVGVCIRWNGHGMSVRVDCPNIAPHGPTLAAIGLSEGSAKHYSMHLKDIDSPVKARKVVGAVCLGLGLDFDMMAAQIDFLQNKGK